MTSRIKFKSARAACSFRFFTMFFGTSLGLLIAGGVLYNEEYPKLTHYKNAICTVLGITYVIEQCSTSKRVYTCIKTRYSVEFRNGTNVISAAIKDSSENYKVKKRILLFLNEEKAKKNYFS